MNGSSHESSRPRRGHRSPRRRRRNPTRTSIEARDEDNDEANTGTPNSDPNWEMDYEQILMTGRAYKSPLVKTFRDSKGNPLWTKSIMICIREMSDKGRAKINNVKVNLYVGSANTNSLEYVENRNADKAVKFLLDNHTDYISGFKSYIGNSWGSVGNLQLAISKMPDAIDGVCEVTGCWTRYNPDNTIDVIKNPWWPGGLSSNIINLTNRDVRSYISYSDSIVRTTGVSLSGYKPDGTPLATITVPPNATGTNVIEINDVTVSDESQQTALAWNLYYKEKSNRKLDLTLKGVGTGIFVGQRIFMTINDVSYGSFIVESVNTNWSNSENRKSWETRLSLKKYF